MKKEELKKIDGLSPYSEENNYNGWRTPLELHNGNVHILVWWKGMLMKLEDGPEKLDKKYYDRYSGKEVNVYEWTLLKAIALKELKELDKKFKKNVRRKTKQLKMNGKRIAHG